jgi:hypothetical protein
LSGLIVPEVMREAHRNGIKRFMATGQVNILNQRIEINAMHRDGHEFPVELTVTPIKWGDSFLFLHSSGISRFARSLNSIYCSLKKLPRVRIGVKACFWRL